MWEEKGDGNFCAEGRRRRGRPSTIIDEVGGDGRW